LVLILETPRASATIRDMDATGVLGQIFPELAPMKGVTQNHYHHQDVWEHSLAVLDLLEQAVEEPGERFGERGQEVAGFLAEGRHRPLAKLAALFHDAGKPATRAMHKDRATFYGHEKESERLALEAALRLRTSARDRDFFATVAGQHLHAENLVQPGVKQKTFLSWFRKTGPPAAAALILASADLRSKHGPATEPEEAEAKSRRAEAWVLEYFAFAATRRDEKPLVTGKELKSLGIRPGPEMGPLLKALRAAQDAGEIRTREEALEMAKGMMEKDGAD
ncbi:MAG: HD domain-containing protein, partial [Pseudomonadota bacterium]